MKWIK